MAGITRTRQHDSATCQKAVVAVCRHGAVYFLADRAQRRLQAFLIGRMVEWQVEQVARAETLLDRPGQKMREMLAGWRHDRGGDELAARPWLVANACARP